MIRPMELLPPGFIIIPPSAGPCALDGSKIRNQRSLTVAQENKKQESNKEDNKKGSNQGGSSERKSEGGQRGNNR
jgi:hypothetical protein